MDNCIWCRTKARLTKLLELSVYALLIGIGVLFIGAANLFLFIWIQMVIDPTPYQTNGFFDGAIIFLSGVAVVSDYLLLDMLHDKIHKNR